MDDVRADFPEDEPDDMDEPYRVEPKSVRARNFIDEDEFEGEDVDLTQRQPTYANTAFSGNLPPLPANLQRMKDVFDLFAAQKAMVLQSYQKKVNKAKRRIEKTDRQLDGMLKGQEELLALVHKQNQRNRRLEDHLASGIGIDKLKKGERQKDPHYDPLDDLSFDDDNEDLATAEEVSRHKKKKKAKAGG
jgi:hypothetical protein